MRPDFKLQIEPLPGWCSEKKFWDIYDTVIELKPKKCVEIGVFAGRSLLAFALAMKEIGAGKVTGIDPYDRKRNREGGVGAADHDWWTDEQLQQIHDELLQRLRDQKLMVHAGLFRFPSHKVAENFAGIDILHIDGNHSELCSCRDVELYLPLVIPGGLIYFDDVNWPTTVKAQGMLAEKCKLLRCVDNCNLYEKL